MAVAALVVAVLVEAPPASAAERSASAPGLHALHLTVCDKPAPVGVGSEPWFGWLPRDDARDALQTGYRIQVATQPALLDAGTPDLWDSGTVTSGAVNAIRYGGAALPADSRCYWRVQLTDDRGIAGPASATAVFDVGPLVSADWSGASWIRRDTAEEDDRTLYRYRFTLPAGAITRAGLHISACHKYDLWLNGAPIGSGPAYHQPDYQYYNGYDLTDRLDAGSENVFAVFARWWGAGQGRPRGARGLLARLTVDYADGRRIVLGTDGSWKQRRADAWEPDTPKRNRTNGIGYIERIHADRLLPGWEQPDFDDTAWDAAVVIGAHPVEPWTGLLQPDLTRAIETSCEPAAWTRLGDGHYVVDFGRVQAGYPQVDFPGGEPGRTVVMTGGYTLEDDGRVSRRTTQKTDLSYVFVLGAGPARFRPAEYLGMRYLEIENAPPGLAAEHVRYVARNYELQPSPGRPHATFSSSNAALDRASRLMVDSIPVCTQEQYIDTPTREKGGFLGDAWSESVAAMIALGDRAMTRRVLEEYLDSQDAFWPDGRVNDVYPYDKPDDIPDYTQMYLLWVWDYYMETGDRAFLQEQYGRLAKIAAYVLHSRRESTGLIHDLEGGKGDYLHGIIDWPKSMRYGYDMETSARTVINAYAAADLRIMARIARTLDRDADAEHYDRAAAALTVAMNRLLIDGEGRYTDGLKPDGSVSLRRSQQANTLPLAFGLVPEEHRSAVLAHIKALRMSSGMVTVRMLVEAVGEAGDGDHLVELFTNETWDGWAKCLALGATCTWESWNAIEGTESLSHAWGAIGLVGHVRYVLGISPLEPQHARVRVRPLVFGKSLSHAAGSIPTDRGTIEVSWRREATGAMRLEVELPDTVRGEIWTPAAPGARLFREGRPIEARRAGAYLVSEAGPGRHVFESR